MLLAILLAYILVASWPVPNPSPATDYANFSLFGCQWKGVSADTRLLFTVMVAGAIGSLIHVLTSFADYAANRQLRWSWVLWFALRLPIGMALGLALYLVVRAGLLPPPSGSGQSSAPANGPAYGFAATSLLVGMFAKQAGDKLKELFDTMFTTKNPVNRADALTASKLAITGTEPKTLTVGDATTPLTINGRGFASTTTATIGDKPRTVTFVGETQITVALVSDDVKQEGKLEIVVQNPAPAAETAKITVVVDPAAETAVKPVITKTDPDLTTGMTPAPLTVSGTGFQENCTATINDEDRAAQWVSATEVTVTVTEDDVATAATLKLVVANPGPDSLSSDPFDLVVT